MHRSQGRLRSQLLILMNMNKLNKQLQEGLFNEAFQSVKALSPEDLNSLFNHFSEKAACNNLLHQFFKFKPQNPDYWFELFLKYFKSEDLLWGIRCTRACFDSAYDNLFSVLENHPDLKVRTHYHFWKHIQPLIELGKEERETLFNSLEQKSLHEWLLYMALWYEEKRAFLWKHDPSGKTHYETTNVYVNGLNLFLDYLLHRPNPDKPKINDVESLSTWVIEKVCREKAKGTNPPEFDLIDKWVGWHHFISTILDSYCFDESYDVEATTEGYCFFCNDSESYFRWKVNGAKLLDWIMKCEEDSWVMTNKQIDEGLEVPGDNINEAFINLQETRINNLTKNLLNYYNLKDAEDFPVSMLMDIINDFSFSALKYWVNPLDVKYMQNADEWYKHILNVNHDILIDEDYTDFMNEMKDYKDTKSALKFAEELLIFNTEAGYLKNYNPYNPKVNIYRTPFIKINSTLFSFTAIIGEARSGLCLIENTLKWLSNDRRKVLRKKQTDGMEKALADLFKEKGWKNVVHGLRYDVGVSKKEGDFDVLIFGDGILLQIELKRSQLRFTLEEAQNEKVQSLNKAAGQILKGRKFIEENKTWIKEQLKLKPEDEIKEIYSLIVSTSFENDHEIINGVCRKIPLFEIEEILKGSDFSMIRNMKLNPLDELRKMIDSEYMAELIKEQVRADFKAPDDMTFYFRDSKS